MATSSLKEITPPVERTFEITLKLNKQELIDLIKAVGGMRPHYTDLYENLRQTAYDYQVVV